MIVSERVGPITVEVVAGDWWLGDRSVLRVLRVDREYEDGGSAWVDLLTVRWRGWRRREREGVYRGRRGVFLGLAGEPDLPPAVVV